jgi:hypothetical protein
VTGRPFSNEINGTLDKIGTITCDKSAKSLRSNQTNTSHQCLARERRKSQSPRPGIAHQISPFRLGQGWFAFSSGPFRPLSGRGRCRSPRTYAYGEQLPLLQRRYPQPRLRNADRPFKCGTNVSPSSRCTISCRRFQIARIAGCRGRKQQHTLRLSGDESTCHSAAVAVAPPPSAS